MSVSITAAAKELGVNVSSIRRWIAAGAPCVRLGEPGRNHGSIVNVQELQRWRAQRLAVTIPERSDDELLHFVAAALMDTYKRDAAERVGITNQQAAGLLVLCYERYYLNLKRTPLDQANLPEEMRQLCAVWLS